MKRKVSVLLMIGVALLLVFAAVGQRTLASTPEVPNTVPFQVDCQTYPEIVEINETQMVLEIPGDCKGTHLGRGEWYADMVVDISSPPPPFLQSGTMVFTAENGDQLFGTFFGFGMPMETGGNYYWGGYQLSEGTGKFDGTTGSGHYHGRSPGEVGTAIFDGTLLKP